MSELDQELKAFEAMKADLEEHHMGKWVVIRRFGRGPFLIRQLGAPPLRFCAGGWLRTY